MATIEVYCYAGQTGVASVGFYNSAAGSYTWTTTQHYTGYPDSVRFTCNPASGYVFDHWEYGSTSSMSNTSSNNPFTYAPSSNATIHIKPVVRSSGGGGGGEETGGEYHYACYNIDAGGYISGYTGADTDDPFITRPNISGYTYEGYVYYGSFDRCVEEIMERGGSYDSTDTYIDMSDTFPYYYVVFFYSGGGGGSGTDLYIEAGELLPVTVVPSSTGTYEFTTNGEIEDTYGYLTYATVSGVTSGRAPNGTILAQNDDGGSGYNFLIRYALSANTAYKIWVRPYSASVAGNTTLFVSPPLSTFYGKVVANGKNGCSVNAKFEHGDSGYSRQRYVRLKLNGSWFGSYHASPETSGGNNTFSFNATGLSAGTVYSYELHLYYIASGAYYSTGHYISGSFTTDQSATGMMIYTNGGWKNAVPYIYTNGSWHAASTMLRANNIWEGA